MDTLARLDSNPHEIAALELNNSSFPVFGLDDVASDQLDGPSEGVAFDWYDYSLVWMYKLTTHEDVLDFFLVKLFSMRPVLELLQFFPFLLVQDAAWQLCFRGFLQGQRVLLLH